MATIYEIQEQLQIVSDNLTTEQKKLANHISDAQQGIQQIGVDLNSLQKEDQEIHKEIHELSNIIDNNKKRVGDIEKENYQGQIDELKKQMDGNDNSLQQQLDDMDFEHHQEMHHIAEFIDSQKKRIDHLSNNQVAEHIVLSEREYEKLGSGIQGDKFYFVYEED